MTIRFLAALLALTLSVAEARPREVETMLPDAARVGEAPYRVLAWTLFDASLWARDGEFSWERPFALTLTYRHAFSAEALTNRSILEMSRGREAPAALEPLRARLNTCFANVAPGDRFTGVSTSRDQARFYLNGVERCEIAWPGFRRDFFGIWLDARNDAGAFSARLRGESR